jgi:plastocyanin
VARGRQPLRRPRSVVRIPSDNLERPGGAGVLTLVVNWRTCGLYVGAILLVAVWLPRQVGAESTETPVDIRNYAFAPKTVTVPAGTSVTWTNDAVIHTVTADDQSWNSGSLEAGASFSHMFATPGIYGYYCIPHGSPGAGMSGTVIVTAAEEAAPQSDPSAPPASDDDDGGGSD